MIFEFDKFQYLPSDNHVNKRNGMRRNHGFSKM